MRRVIYTTTLWSDVLDALEKEAAKTSPRTPMTQIIDAALRKHLKLKSAKSGEV